MEEGEARRKVAILQAPMLQHRRASCSPQWEVRGSRVSSTRLPALGSGREAGSLQRIDRRKASSTDSGFSADDGLNG